MSKIIALSPHVTAPPARILGDAMAARRTIGPRAYLPALPQVMPQLSAVNGPNPAGWCRRLEGFRNLSSTASRRDLLEQQRGPS